MPGPVGSEQSVFDPAVASRAQDLLDARLAPLSKPKKSSHGAATQAAGAVVGWTAGAENCLRLLSDLVDGAEFHPVDASGSRIAELRQTIDTVREALGGVVDGQAAAIWFSLPFQERVWRIRQLAKHVGSSNDRAKNGLSARAKATALRQWHVYLAILEDRARLDPTAASEAGYVPGASGQSGFDI